MAEPMATEIVKFIPSKFIALFSVSTLLLNPNIFEFAIFKMVTIIKGSFSIIEINVCISAFPILLYFPSSITLEGRAGKEFISSNKSYFIIINTLFQFHLHQ